MKLSTLVAGVACSGAASALYIPPGVFDFNMTKVVNVDNIHGKAGKAPEHIANKTNQSVNAPIVPKKSCIRSKNVDKLIARLNATAPTVINQVEARLYLREDNVSELPEWSSYPSKKEMARALVCLQKLTDITDITVRNQTETDRLQACARQALIRQGLTPHGDVTAIIVKIRERKVQALSEKLEVISEKLEAILASQRTMNVAVNHTEASGDRGLKTRDLGVPDASLAHLDIRKLLREHQRKVASPTPCNTTDRRVAERLLLREALSTVIFADLPVEGQPPRGPTLIKGGCEGEGHGSRDCYVEPREDEEEE